MRERVGDVGRGDDCEDQASVFIRGKSIKQICRDLRVSRNTVRKVVRSGATEFSYDRSTQPRPKIDPWRSELDEMLAENARQAKRQRLTLVRIFEELRNRGYDGSYDAVRRYAANWLKATREASAAAYVPLSFDPGEAYQFDSSHEAVLIDGATTTVKVAHVHLSHSRMPFVRAYPRETQEMVFDARAVGRPVEIRAYADRLECWQDGKVVGQHERPSGATKLSSTPCITYPFWPASPAPCATRHRSRNGSCRSQFAGYGANWGVSPAVTDEWSTS